MKDFIKHIFTPDLNEPEDVFVVVFVFMLSLSFVSLWFFN